MKRILKEENSGWMTKPFFDEIKKNMPSVEELIKMAKERSAKKNTSQSNNDELDSDEKDDLINKY
jgi:hypothetical protein